MNRTPKTRTPTTASLDPFAVLGLAPTLDAAMVKRAYFAALARHPPHADPEGFRRIRAAYEALRGEGLRAAHLRAPIGTAGDEASAVERLRVARTVAVARADARVADLERIADFEALLATPWDAVVARLRES